MMVGQLKYFVLALVSVTFTLGEDEGTLISVIQLYRHGARTPVQFYANDPYQDFSYWNLSEGQLTTVGQQQHYALGQYIRNRYNGFLSDKYFREDFLVQTTHIDRTHMSALADIAGLFPPKDFQIWNPDLLWQAIPVFPADPAIVNAFDVCTKYTNALSDLLSKDTYYVSLNAEYQDLFAYLTEYSGTNVTSISGVTGIWDTLYIESLRNFTLPSWTDSVFPQPLTNITYDYYTAFGGNYILKRLSAGGFLHEVIDRFERYLNNDTTTQKYLQFSAHDANIASVLNTLGAFVPHVPNFASTLLFELREKNGINVINIYYKRFEEPEPITVAGCAFDCSLVDFKRILSNVTITPAQWLEECNSEEQRAPESFVRHLRLRGRRN